MDIVKHQSLRDDLDLACSITGLYRILDLITEQGVGGLGSTYSLSWPTRSHSLVPISVGKIIIPQNPLGAFINTVCPGAYASMTKVNFKALDRYVIKPVGIYGSKEEIVRFLLKLDVADDSLYVAYYVLCANSSSLGLHNY